MRTDEHTIAPVEWLIETGRERHGNDKRAINRHSVRRYVDHTGHVYLVDRVLDAVPPYFQFCGPVTPEFCGLMPNIKLPPDLEDEWGDNIPDMNFISWSRAFKAFVGSLKKSKILNPVAFEKPENLIRWAIGELRYEKRTGVHTMHQCECGRGAARNTMCAECWHEEIRHMADVAGIRDDSMTRLMNEGLAEEAEAAKHDF